MAHLIIKITSNALDTLVAAKENCFHEPLKAIKTVSISKFIRQRVPDCRAGIVERPTAVRAMLPRHSVEEPTSIFLSGRRLQGGPKNNLFYYCNNFFLLPR